MFTPQLRPLLHTLQKYPISQEVLQQPHWRQQTSFSKSKKESNKPEFLRTVAKPIFLPISHDP